MLGISVKGRPSQKFFKTAEFIHMEMRVGDLSVASQIDRDAGVSLDTRNGINNDLLDQPYFNFSLSNTGVLPFKSSANT